MVRGVRSSWDALATKRRWLANAASRRSSISSKVSASSFSSPGGPRNATRSSRFVCEARRAASVTAWRGRRARPATSQPSTAETTAMPASAASDVTSRLCRVLTRCLFAPASNSALHCCCSLASGMVPPVFDDPKEVLQLARSCGSAVLGVLDEARSWATRPYATASSNAPLARNRPVYATVSRRRRLRWGRATRAGTRCPRRSR